MASPVVFWLRVKNPKYKKMPEKNRANILYIGTRSGVVKNKDMEHGLFGKYNNMDFGDIKDIYHAADYVKQKTKKGTNMHRCVISLTESDAIKKGFDNRKEWESMIQQNIFAMAEKLDIPASRLEYVCAVHMERGHPHMHLTIWDKEQGIKKARVAPEISNDIRKMLIKSVFHDELAVLYEKKNKTRQALTDGGKDFFDSFFEPLQGMTMEELDLIADQLRENPDHAEGYIFSPKIPNETLDKFALQVLAFKKKMPQSGRTTYKTLAPELKEELKAIVKYLIQNNEDFSREFETYIEINKELAGFYVSKENQKQAEEKAAISAEEDILKRLSNQLLKEIKSMDIPQEQEQNQQEYLRYQAFIIMKNLFSFFSRLTETEQRRAIALDRRKGELSKQAKKEMAIKLEHTSHIDWER